MTLLKAGYRALWLRSLLFICTFFSLKGSFGQLPADGSTRFFIALSPLSLFDYHDGSSIRISLEARVGKKLSLSAENIFYTSMGNSFAYKKDPRGFGIKPCLKFYLKKKDWADARYLGLEYLYKHQTYRLSDSINLNMATFFKNYSMRRYINCISLKYGELRNMKGRMIFEWFGGVGIRFFNSASSLSRQEYDGVLRDEVYDNSTGGGDFVRTIGTSIYPNFVVGIKLGYRIR